MRHQQLLAIGVVTAAQHDGLEGRDARGDRAATPHGRPRLPCDVGATAPHLAAATPASTKQKTHTSPEEEEEEVIRGGINDATAIPNTAHTTVVARAARARKGA